jgi:hypothetical protein
VRSEEVSHIEFREKVTSYTAPKETSCSSEEKQDRDASEGIVRQAPPFNPTDEGDVEAEGNIEVLLDCERPTMQPVSANVVLRE